MKNSVIEIDNLRKVFGNGTVALDGISLRVDSGEIFGFLGQNGAGKTTTVSILTTMLKKTSGEVYVNGVDVDKDPHRVRKTIGLVFQGSTNDIELTGRENLEYVSGLNGLSSRETKNRIDELLAEMGLSDVADDLVSNYSGGMKRKLEIAAAMVHEPEVMFLDEPTLGLDPSSRAEFWKYIRRIRKNLGTTIFVNTHYLDEADQLCDRISIIDHGKIITSGTPAQLKGKLQGDVIEISTAASEKDVSAILESVSGVNSVSNQDNSTFVRCENSSQIIPDLFVACNNAGIEIKSLVVHKPSLEQVFLRITGSRFEEPSVSFPATINEKGGAQ